MSTTTAHDSFDSGYNHIKPFITAAFISAATIVISLLIVGLPH